MIEISIFIVVLMLGLIFGTINERKHYESIESRERIQRELPMVTFGKIQTEDLDSREFKLVTGSVVISIDSFKKLVAGVINLFGGSIISYESLVDRARREALLRLKESAPGASQIVNTRIETMSISKGKKKTVGAVEVLAYGTAVYE